MPTRPRVSPPAGVTPFGLLGRAPRRRDLGHRAEAARQRQLAAEWREAQSGPHPARIGEELEERAADEPVAEGAARLGLDRLARRLDQLVVLDARGAGGHAGHAAEAQVEVLDDGRVERDRAVEVRLHQLDPARAASPSPRSRAGTSGTSAGRSRSGRSRSSASGDVGRGRHASTPAGSKRSRTRSCRRRTGSAVAVGDGIREVRDARRRADDGGRGSLEERPQARPARTTSARAPRPGASATRPRPRRPSPRRRRATRVAATCAATAAAPPSNSTATRPGWRMSTALGTSWEASSAARPPLPRRRSRRRPSRP